MTTYLSKRKRGRPSKAKRPEILPVDILASSEQTILNLQHKIEQYKVVIDYLETKLGLPK